MKAECVPQCRRGKTPWKKKKNSVFYQREVLQKKKNLHTLKTSICQKHKKQDLYQIQGFLSAVELNGFWKETHKPSCIFWSSISLYLQMVWHNQRIEASCLANLDICSRSCSKPRDTGAATVTWGQPLRKLLDAQRFELWAEPLPSGRLSAWASKAGDICTHWPS